MAGTSSQGTSFSFAGFSAFATKITVSAGQGQGQSTQRQRVSAACMADNPNGVEPFFYLWKPDPSGSGAEGNSEQTKQVQISYIGQTMPVSGAVGSLAITGKINFIFTATVLSSSVTAAVGDVVRGDVVFSVT